MKVTLGSDEELQALQEQQLKEQQEQYQNQMQQYEDYFNQRDDNSRWQQWPWDSFQMPWELWDDMDNGNLG